MKVDVTTASGRQLAEAVRRGSITVPQIVEYHLEQVNRWNPKLNAVRWFDAAGLRNQAQGVQASVASNPFVRAARLLGMVLSIKDSIHVAGMPRSDGSVAGLKRQGGTTTSMRTADTVLALQRESALLLGKANMAEMGRSYFTENPLFGRTNNPFSLDRSPGGSGGGDAAAIATRMVMAGVGADSGGSIRVPAAFCGVFGMYPTPGTVPTTGMSGINHTTRSLLRNHGPLAYYLDDIETLLLIMQWSSPTDPFSVPVPVQRPSLRTKKFLWYTQMNGVRADRQLAACVEATVQKLEQLGLHGEERTPSCVQECLEPFVILAGQAALIIDDQRALAEGFPNDPQSEGPLMQRLRGRISQFLPPLTAERLLEVWYHCHRLRYEAATLFLDYDFIVSPVTASLPPPHGAAQYLVDGQDLPSEQVYRFASAVNVLGLPALSCPVRLSAEGLPLAVQLIGPRFSDRVLIEVARMCGYTQALALP